MLNNDFNVRALIEFAQPKYRSKVEAEWASIGSLRMQAFFSAKIIAEHFEPFTINLPGPIKYTPDFFYILENGVAVLAEIKKSKKNKGYAVSLNKLKTAAAIYPYFIYVMVTKEDGWKISIIGGDK